MGKSIHLPRFQEALKAHSESLATGTYWRYANGLIPAFGQFIINRPDLIQALAEDAEELKRSIVSAPPSAARPQRGQRRAERGQSEAEQPRLL